MGASPARLIQIECGFWEGQDPVDVAIEFGTLHSLSASQIRKLRQVLTQEVNDRLERMVRANMVQWFWIHRRWKPERERRG